MQEAYSSLEVSLVPVPLPQECEDAYRLAISILVDLISAYMESEAQSPVAEDCAR
jgi:hypothetical protein